MHDRIPRDASPWSDWGNSWSDWDNTWIDWNRQTWVDWDNNRWSNQPVTNIHSVYRPAVIGVIAIICFISIATIFLVLARLRGFCCFQQRRRPVYGGVPLSTTLPMQQYPAAGGSGWYPMGVVNTTQGIDSQQQRFHPPPGSYPVQPGAPAPVDHTADQYSSQPDYYPVSRDGAEPDPQGDTATATYNQPQAGVDIPPPSYDSLKSESMGFKAQSPDKQEIDKSGQDASPSAPPPS